MMRSLLNSCIRKIYYSTSADLSSNLAFHFLKNSCFLPQETALLVASKIPMKRTKNPHVVLSLLKSYNFTDPDIKKVVTLHPNLLLSNPHTNLKPKLDFFQSIGFSGCSLIKLVTCVPELLRYSLQNKLLPNYKLLKAVLHTDANVISAIRSCAMLLVSDLEKTLLPKVKFLEGNGVSVHVIHKILTMHNKHLIERPNRFHEIFEFVQKTGISTKTPMYAHAFGVFGRIGRVVWENKVECFKKLGWTEEEVMVAFTKHPYVMSASTDKVKKNFEFYKEKFGWDSTFVSKNSNVLSLSFEGRVLVRYRVLNVLQRKGLCCGKVGAMMLKLSEKNFLEKFVVKYCKEVPELIDDDVKRKLEDFGLLIENS